MVPDRKKDSEKTPVKQGPEKVFSEPNKIGPATPYDFDGKNLTAYGGLLPVGTLLEKLGFRPIARHRSREVELYRQGSMNEVLSESGKAKVTNEV